MPVHKYRSVGDMPRPPVADDESLEARIRTLLNRAFLLSPPRYTRGVMRFRSVEEAQAHRAAEIAARLRNRDV